MWQVVASGLLATTTTKQVAVVSWRESIHSQMGENTYRVYRKHNKIKSIAFLEMCLDAMSSVDERRRIDTCMSGHWLMVIWNYVYRPHARLNTIQIRFIHVFILIRATGGVVVRALVRTGVKGRTGAIKNG